VGRSVGRPAAAVADNENKMTNVGVAEKRTDIAGLSGEMALANMSVRQRKVYMAKKKQEEEEEVANR
jgi:hypothetical protein